jgi:hypothetical protein
MKNFILFTFVMGFQVLSAQLVEWKWDLYKIKFEAPGSFKVSKNDKTEFSAGDEHIYFSIFPEKNEDNTKQEHYEDDLIAWANDSKISYNGEVGFLEDLNGYWGYYIDGVADNGNPTSVFVLVDPDFPELYFFIWVQYQEEYYEQALEILMTISPI